MDDLDKQQGTFSIPHQALCIISKPSVNSNLSNNPETLNAGQNRRFLVPCDLEIWRLTLEKNRAHLLWCFKLCVSFHCHQWIQTGVTVRTRPIWVKIDDFIVLCDLDIWTMTLKNNRAPFNSGQNRRFFVPCDLEIWRRTLKNNRAPLLYYFKLCATFRSREWIQTGVTVRKRPIWVKINDIVSPVTLKFDKWHWK